MTVKEMVALIGYGSAYEIRGAYSGRIYHRSYNNGGSNLAKYSENAVTDTPLYTTLRLRGDDVSNGWCVPVIGIWMDDYDIARRKGKRDDEKPDVV